MLSALCLLIVASCKKDEKTDDQAPDCLITESTKTSSMGKTEKALITYNADGKVSNVKFTEGNNAYEMNYTYSNLQIKTVETDGDDTYTTIYSLDAQGRIVSRAYDGGDPVIYTYNADGYLSEINEWGIIITKYSYTNGNLTTESKGNLIKTYTYGKEPSKGNFFHEGGIAYESLLVNYFGKRSMYLPSKCTNTYNYARNAAEEELYTYEKDANGNITKVSFSRTNDDYSYVVSSKYNCK